MAPQGSEGLFHGARRSEANCTLSGPRPFRPGHRLGASERSAEVERSVRRSSRQPETPKVRSQSATGPGFVQRRSASRLDSQSARMQRGALETEDAAGVGVSAPPAKESGTRPARRRQKAVRQRNLSRDMPRRSLARPKERGQDL